MPAFPIHFATDRNAPFPPLDSLPTIDVAEPLTGDGFRFALREYLEIGRGPHDSADYRWARIVVSQHSNGDVRQFISQEVHAADVIKIDPVKPPEQI